MSEQLQLRRGTAAQVAAFTGAQGEATFDTTNNRLVLNDGATAGGWPHGLETRRAVSDAATTILATDRFVAYTALTAARAITLPTAVNYPPGAFLVVSDESGACSATKPLTISAVGSDTLAGLAAGSAAISTAYGSLTLESNGVNAWTIVDQTSLAQSPHGALAQLVIVEQLVSGLSGASVIAGTQIPAGALMLACSMRVVTAIVGPTSFEIGYTGSLTAFGSGLSLPAGSTNEGMIGPLPVYSATNIVLTATGANFSAGAVRLALTYILFASPSS